MDIIILLAIMWIIAIIIIFIVYKFPEKSKTLKRNIKLEDKHLKELKSLIQETRQLDKAKEKIQKWKKEGYDVSELEKFLEGVK